MLPHLAVVAILFVNGCRTPQPPTPSGASPGDDAAGSEAAGPRGADGWTSSSASSAAGEGARRPPRRPAEEGAGDREGVAAFNQGIEPLEPSEPGRAPGDSAGGGAPGDSASVDASGASASDGESAAETYAVKRGDTLWGIAQARGVSLDRLLKANDLSRGDVLRVGQELRVPGGSGGSGARSGSGSGGSAAAENASAAPGGSTYTVQRGDTLSGIARRHDTTVRALKRMNDKDSSLIRPGETLKVPGSGGGSDGGETDGGSASGGSAGGSASSAGSSGDPGSSESSGSVQYHTVKSGEYPASIARRYGMTTSELLALNGIRDPRSIPAGERLKVSASGSGGDSSADSGGASGSSGSVSIDPDQPAGSGGGDGSGASDEAAAVRVVPNEPLSEEEQRELDRGRSGRGGSGRSSGASSDRSSGSTPSDDSRFEGAGEVPIVPVDEQDSGS